MLPLHNRLADLSNEEVKRYSRHVIMPEVGIEGQRRLKASNILLIGTGGLGRGGLASSLGLFYADHTQQDGPTPRSRVSRLFPGWLHGSR